MRAWPILLITAATLSGCSGLVAVDGADADAGRPFDPMEAPTWEPGFRFRYETSGEAAFGYRSDTDEGREGGSEGQSWEDEPGLDYTVLNTEETVHGEPAYLARAVMEHDAMLIAVLADDLSVRSLGYGLGCTPMMCHDGAVAPTDSGLRFPLIHGDAWASSQPEDEAPMFTPMRVETEVLGLTTVEGPDGPVDAVHVRHLAEGDMAQLRRRMVEQARESGEDVRDVAVDGEVTGRRDVYYAPSLRNVVLDASEAVGRIAVSFTQEGRRQSFEADFTMRLENRLAQATFEVTEQVPLATILAETPTPPVWPEARVVDPMRLSIEPPVVNVAEAQEVDIVADASGLPVEVTVVDAAGFFVTEGDKGHPWTSDGHATYVLDAPGVYLVTATARDHEGRVAQVRQGVIEAHYHATVDASCAVVSTSRACDTLTFPMGPGVGRVDAVALIGDPLPADTPGDLVLSWSGGEATAPRRGDTAAISVEPDPLGTGFAWDLSYVPELGVAQRVTYEVTVTPDPDIVDGLRASAARHEDEGSSWAPPVPPPVLQAFGRLLS